MRDDREAWQPRHPAYRGLVEQLVQDAQDEQSMRAANKELYDLDEWGIAPPRRIDELHHEATTSGKWWVHVFGPLGLVAGIVAVILLFGFLGAVHGGWPA